MNNQQSMIALIRSVSGQSNVLTIPRLYIDLTKSHRAALVLSQCVYWSDRGGRDGWFYKTYKDWQDELGMPRGAIDTALKKIRAWVETDIRKVGGTPKTHYRVDVPLLAAAVMEMLEAQETRLVGNRQVQMLETSKSDMSETDKSSLTEITTETPSIKVAAKKSRQRDSVFDAIVEVCAIDLTIEGSDKTVGKVAAALKKAIPPYAAEEILAWGKAQAWRTTPPTVWQLKQGVSTIRRKPQAANGSNGATAAAQLRAEGYVDAQGNPV